MHVRLQPHYVYAPQYASKEDFCLQAQAAETGSLLPAKAQGKQKQASSKANWEARKAVAPSAGERSDDDQEDLLQDYELSDDSEMED